MKTVEEFLSSNGFVTADQLDRQGIISSFLDEMAKGLKGEKSSLAMIPSYIGVNKQLPEGAKVAVLDAGGTNFRSAIVAIPATVESRMNRPMPGAGEEVDKETFYATFAEEVRRVLPLANMARMGWCFSSMRDHGELGREVDAMDEGHQGAGNRWAIRGRRVDETHRRRRNRRRQ